MRMVSKMYLKDISEDPYFINTSESTKFSENVDIDDNDPLQGTASFTNEPEYHRIDSVVFAEPLPILNIDPVSYKDAKENIHNEVVIDNVIIQKRRDKKYKKYLINFNDPRSMICPQPNCKRTFLTTKLLKAHIRKVHCAVKKYVCDICGCMFACQYLLVRHSAVHNSEKVQCSVCALELSRRTSLSAHMRTHSSTKPHACSTCGKVFARKSTRDTHVKFVHRVDKLQCSNCSERFDTRSQWTQHTFTHHLKKTEDCKLKT